MPRGTETTGFSVQAVPNDTPVSLAVFLRRLMLSIREEFSSLYSMPITSVAPAKEVEGMLRYADGTAWDPGAGKGVYVYDGTAWVKL